MKYLIVLMLMISSIAYADRVPPPKNEQRVVVQDVQTSGGKGRDLALVAIAAVGIGIVIWHTEHEKSKVSLFVQPGQSGQAEIGVGMRSSF